MTSDLLGQIEGKAEQIRNEIDREEGYTGTGRSIVQHMLASVGAQPYGLELQRNAGNRQAQIASGSHLAELNIQVLPSEERSVSSADLVTRLRAAVGQIPDAVALSFTSSFFTTGKDVDIQLYHQDLGVLQKAAKELKQELLRRPDLTDVTDSLRPGKPEITLTIDPRAESLGLTQMDLARQVRQAFFGEEAQRIQRGRDDVKVMVRYPAANRRSIADLQNMRIRGASGNEVPFHEVAQASVGRSYSSITRVDGRRMARVSAEIDENNPDAQPEIINQGLRDNVLPGMLLRYPGLTYGFEGDQKKQAELFAALGVGFLFAAFLIYALMAVPLRSYAQPFVIMTAIPFGAGGAVLGHLVSGHDLSIMSLFGGLALTGVVVNDNIVLVDCINKQRVTARNVLEAVRDAGARRFRPILLTSLTTFGGLMPLLLEKSVQARFLIPMAVSLGCGVLFATFVSLLIVPCIYLVLNDCRRFFTWLYGSQRQAAEPDLSEPVADHA